MAVDEGGQDGETRREDPRRYPLLQTAALLNEELGLYLSEEQQRGLATGLLVGTVLGSAIIAASVVAWIREQ